MFFNSMAAVELEADELGYLEEHEVEGGGLPYMQVLTHPNESIVKVKGARPWGIFLNSENAEAINFKPDANWQPVTFYTVEDEGFANAVLKISDADRKAYETAGQEITEHTGFVATTVMFHLIYQSETEVERKELYQGRPSYKFAGLRWGSDEHKEAMSELLKERDDDDNPTHRWCQRYMFILIGADGNPLHDGVITYRAKGGAGGAFSMEMNELFKDLNDAYGKGKGNQRLNLFSGKNRHAGDMRSFVRLAVQFDLYKGGKDRAPYLVRLAGYCPQGTLLRLKCARLHGVRIAIALLTFIHRYLSTKNRPRCWCLNLRMLVHESGQRLRNTPHSLYRCRAARLRVLMPLPSVIARTRARALLMLLLSNLRLTALLSFHF